MKRLIIALMLAATPVAATEEPKWEDFAPGEWADYCPSNYDYAYLSERAIKNWPKREPTVRECRGIIRRANLGVYHSTKARGNIGIMAVGCAGYCAERYPSLKKEMRY